MLVLVCSSPPPPCFILIVVSCVSVLLLKYCGFSLSLLFMALVILNTTISSSLKKPVSLHLGLLCCPHVHEYFWKTYRVRGVEDFLMWTKKKISFNIKGVRSHLLFWCQTVGCNVCGPTLVMIHVKKDIFQNEICTCGRSLWTSAHVSLLFRLVSCGFCIWILNIRHKMYS